MPSLTFDQLQALVTEALADQQLTRQEQHQIMAAILADHQISSDEQKILEMIAQKLKRGEIKAVD